MCLKKILIVEDEQDLRELVGKYFGDMEYQAVVTADGADALEPAKEQEPPLEDPEFLAPRWTNSHRVR